MAGGLIALSGAQQPTPPSAVINRYCIGCHNSKLNTAGLALDALSPQKVDQHPEAWEKVVRKLRARYMPPAGLPRPDERAYNAFVSELETSLDSAAAAKPNPGRTDTFRRLNRTEYQNAIRDLLALDVDVASLLPSDESSHGFDNVTVGDLSPTLLERYLSAAQKISRLAIGSPEPFSGRRHHHASAGPHAGGALRRTSARHARRSGGSLHLPAGRRVRDSASPGARPQRARRRSEREPHEVELMLDGERVQIVHGEAAAAGHRIITPSIKDLNVRIPVKAGPHVVAVAFPKKPSALLETERQPYQAHFNMDRHPRIQPAVYSISVNGPYEAERSRRHAQPPPDFRLQAGERRARKKAARNASSSTLMRRAYRRPVTDADLQVPLKFYREARERRGL